jgi:hypothetical protein
MRNPCLTAALDELETAGVRDVTVARTGGGHYQIRYTVREHDHRILGVSSTPSDVNAPNQVRRQIRKALRTDGLLVEERKPKASPVRQPSQLEVLTQRVAALEQRLAKLEAER